MLQLQRTCQSRQIVSQVTYVRLASEQIDSALCMQTPRASNSLHTYFVGWFNVEETSFDISTHPVTHEVIREVRHSYIHHKSIQIENRRKKNAANSV